MTIVRSPEPRNQDGWEIEALTSYLVRWAEFLNVSVTTLWQKMVAPMLAYDWENRTLRKARFIDEGRSAQPAINAIEALTGRDGVANLTCTSLTSIFQHRGLFRPTYSWCPHCLQESAAGESDDRDVAQRAYSPLIWRLFAYSVCVKHEVLMEQTCCHCGYARLYMLWTGARVGCCSNCRKWLGRDFEAPSQAPDIGMLAESVCVAEIFNLQLERSDVLELVRWCVRYLYSERSNFYDSLLRVNKLTRSMGFSRLTGESKPPLNEVTGVAIAGRMSMEELLFNPNSSLPSQPLEPTLPLSTAKEDRQAERERRLRARLQEVLKHYWSTGFHPPRTTLAEDLGIGLKTLSKLDPELIQRVDEQYHARNVKVSPPERIRMVVDELILAGLFPSRDRVVAKGFFLNDRFRQLFAEERERRGIPVGLAWWTADAMRAVEAERLRLLTLRNSEPPSQHKDNER